MTYGGCLLIGLQILLGSPYILAQTATQNLHSYLTANHDPASHPDTFVNVSFDGSLYQLIEVDEVKQAITVLIWLTHTWHDPTLAWTAAVSNLTETYLPEEKIWRPDILLLNQLDNNEIYDTTPNFAQISSNGLVLYQYPIIYTAFCAIDVSLFPYDSQECTMKFGAWMLPLTMVDMYAGDGSIDLTQTQENTLWIIKDVTMTRNMKYYECCPKGYSVDITLTFYLKRRPEYYYFTLIIPCIIISAGSLMGTFFPTESGGVRHEKTMLGITTMLTMAVFLLMVADDLPEDSTNVPLISVYIFMQILINTVGTFTAAAILHYHCKDLNDEPVPEKLQHFLKRVFRLTDEDVAARREESTQIYLNSRVRLALGKDDTTVRPKRVSHGKQQMNWEIAMNYVDKLALYLHLGVLILVTIIMLFIIPAAYD